MEKLSKLTHQFFSPQFKHLPEKGQNEMKTQSVRENSVNVYHNMSKDIFTIED